MLMMPKKYFPSFARSHKRRFKYPRTWLTVSGNVSERFSRVWAAVWQETQSQTSLPLPLLCGYFSLSPVWQGLSSRATRCFTDAVSKQHQERLQYTEVRSIPLNHLKLLVVNWQLAHETRVCFLWATQISSYLRQSPVPARYAHPSHSFAWNRKMREISSCLF